MEELVRFDAPSAESAQEARRAVRTWLRRVRVDDDIAASVELVTSELATNAIRHACTWFTVRAALLDGIVRLEVADGDWKPPVHRRVDHDAIGGRGIQIVDALTNDWGTVGGAEGKTVWASWRCR